MKTTTLTIGQLAKAAGVNVETIRYYQRVGLITEPPKPAEGYRRYPQEAVLRIQFIKRAKQLGFTLDEISELLALGEGHCNDVRKRAETKRAQVVKQIQDLTALQITLDELIGACMKGADPIACPIVESLTTNNSQKS